MDISQTSSQPSIPTDVLVLIENMVANERKSTAAAYFLWFFLAGVGGHRFYLRDYKAGALYIVFGFVIMFLTTATPELDFLWIPWFIFWVIDAFRIPSFIRKLSEKTRSDLITKYVTSGHL